MRRPVPVAAVLLRGAALFAGVFLAVGLFAGLRAPALDTTHWLLDLRGLPGAARVGLLALAAIVGAWWGVRPPRGRARAPTAGAFAVLAGVAMVDAVQVLAAAGEGGFDLALPPLSLGVALVFGLAAWRARHDAPAPLPAVAAAAGLWALGFAAALMACFGSTDYRREADAVVVLGARAYADGRPSTALADRVRTAAGLVQAGYAPILVVSGGPGDGAVHETDAMRRVAVSRGVPADRILVDRDGVDTRATARNVAALLRARGARTALVVSHAYHLPRVKSTFDREGFRTFTVPAEESRVLAAMPWFVAREAAAWWVYWWRDGLAARAR